MTNEARIVTMQIPQTIRKITDVNRKCYLSFCCQNDLPYSSPLKTGKSYSPKPC